MLRNKREPKFGKIAITLGYISKDDLEKALEIQSAGELWGVGFILLRLGKLTLEQIKEVLSYQDVSFVNVDEEIESENYEHQRLGEIAVSSKAIKYSDLLHALEQKSRMKELDGTEPKLGKVLVDLNLITEDQLKNLLSKGGINVYQCQRCSRIYNVKRFSPRKFCCPFCHHRDQIRYESDVLNIEGRLQVGNFRSIKTKLDETHKFILERSLGKISHYEVIEEIGIGRMGVVSKVREEKTGKIYALKAFIIDNEYKETALNYFEHHFAKYQQLSHPNIAKVLEFSKFENLLYAIFEYTDGIPLDLWLLREGTDVRRKIEILNEIAKTLAFAHENNVYHLNLHPGNIFVDKNGRIKITDFSIPAPLIDASIDSAVYGMRKYLAPENFIQDIGSLEAKTDQYAFGCLAYEILASNPPFSAVLLSELHKQLEKGLPPAIESKYLTPYKDFESVIFKCLETRIASRYANMYEVVEDCNSVLRGEDPSANPVTKRRRLYQKYGRFSKLLFLPLIGALVFLAIQLFFGWTEVIDKKINTPTFVDEEFSKIESAQLAFEQKDFKTAKMLITGMSEEVKNEPEVLKLVLQLANVDENYPKILEIYRGNRGLVREIDNVFIFVRAAKEQSDYSLTLRILLESYEFHKSDPEIYPELMNMLAKLKRWGKLLEVGEYAISTLDVNEDYFAYSCFASGKLKKWNKSQTYFMQALASSKNKALAYHFRALVNFDRLGSNDKQNLRILDMILRDAKKAQNLNSRIPGNAYFIRRVNKEILGIKYKFLVSGVNIFESTDNNLLIDAAESQAILEKFNIAQQLLARVDFDVVSSKKLIAAANSYYLCGNYDKVLELFRIAEKKQNFLLNDYLLLIKTLKAKEKLIQAYLYCHQALEQYPDNYDLMFEYAQIYIEISKDNTPNNIIERFKVSSLFHSKYLYLQSMLSRAKKHYISEREALTEILQNANSQTDEEIYDKSLLKLLDISLRSPRKLNKKRMIRFLEFLRYSQNVGLLHTKMIKKLLQGGYQDIAQDYHKIVKLEIEGVKDFDGEINLLFDIYTFKHADILARLAKGEDLRGKVVNGEDIAMVAEFSDRADVKDAIIADILRDSENSWARKDQFLKHIYSFAEKSGKSVEQIANLISTSIEEEQQIFVLLQNKQEPSDYFTFIKSWGAENLLQKLKNLIKNGEIFECYNHLERYHSKKPGENLAELGFTVNNILGFSQETLEKLILYKEIYLRNPKLGVIENALLTAIREQNEKNFATIIQRFSDLIPGEKAEFYELLNNFFVQKIHRALFFSKLSEIILGKLADSSFLTSRPVKLFIQKAIKSGFFSKLDPKILNLAGAIEGLDNEFVYFMQTIERGLLLQNNTSNSIMNHNPAQNRNTVYMNVVDSNLSGNAVISDFLLTKLSTTKLNDRTALFFQMLYDETATKLDVPLNLGTPRRITAFLRYLNESDENALAEVQFANSFERILQLVKTDKLISEENIELAEATLNAIDETAELKDLLNFLHKKIHFAKGEFSLAAQIITKQEYESGKSLQLLSELQSEDARFFQMGVERLISDTSIDSDLLFDAASVLYSSAFKLDINQINSIFKHNRIELSNDPKLRLANAILLKSIDRNQEADKIFEDLMRFYPQNSKVYLIAARLAIIDNDFEKAVTIIEKSKENKAESFELTQLEILMLILNEKYSQALDKALKLISKEAAFDKAIVIKYLQFLSSKLPPLTQKLIFEQIYSLVPEDKTTNELALISAFMLDDVKGVYEVAEQLYQKAIEKTKYAKWMIWAQCRQEDFVNALKLLELYSSKNDPWIIGAKMYCEIALKDFEFNDIERIKKLLNSISKEGGNAELMLWGSLIAQKIGEAQLARRLKTEGTDFMPDNLSAIYNLIVDRINSGRFRDAETLIKQGDQNLATWQPFNLVKFLIAGKTNLLLSQISGFRETLRNSSSFRIFEMTFWLLQGLIAQDSVSEKDISWLNNQIIEEKLNAMSVNSEVKAEILAMQGIIAFQRAKYEQASEFWAHSAKISKKYSYLNSYVDSIKESYSSAN